MNIVYYCPTIKTKVKRWLNMHHCSSENSSKIHLGFHSFPQNNPYIFITPPNAPIKPKIKEKRNEWPYNCSSSTYSWEKRRNFPYNCTKIAHIIAWHEVDGKWQKPTGAFGEIRKNSSILEFFISMWESQCAFL